MNKQTLESLLKQAEDLIHSLLKGDMDERTAWMLILSYIVETLRYEIESKKERDYFQ